MSIKPKGWLAERLAEIDGCDERDSAVTYGCRPPVVIHTSGIQDRGVGVGRLTGE